MSILKILGAVLGLFLLYVLFLAVCSLLVDPHREYDQHSSFYRWLLNCNAAAVLKLLRVRVHISGVEKLPSDAQKLLFVSNHRSNFDPIVTWYALRQWQIAFISKPENFKIPIFGRYIRKCCFLAIDRQNPRNALKTINHAAKLLEDGQVSIGVYPEGTRSREGGLLPFHNGVMKIAQRANAPIAILSISGTEAIHKNILRRHSDVYLTVVKVLSAETVAGSRTNVLGAQIREEIEQSLMRCEVAPC